jgi:hypothetical protein
MFGERIQGSIHALIILFMVSTLIFLSSFISLTHHDTHHPNEHHYKNSREHMLEQSRKQIIPKVSPPKSSDTETKSPPKSSEASHENKSNKNTNKKQPNSHPNKKSAKNKKETEPKKDTLHEKDHHQATHGNKYDHSTSSHEPKKILPSKPHDQRSESSTTPVLTTIQKKPRTLRFPAACHINPHIHYWDEYLESNISPLRAYHGLSVPYDQQKFIVFQPDLGGWNNIRMALEVVILLAKVSKLK